MDAVRTMIKSQIASRIVLAVVLFGIGAVTFAADGDPPLKTIVTR